jgi:DNA primase
VQPEKGMFYCFGCHKGGSVFNFLMEAEKLSFTEAVETLGRQVGIEVRHEEGDSGEASRKKTALTELFRRVAGSFHYLLTQTETGKAALSYLAGRGITRETIDVFQIGYAPADPFWLEAFLKKHGYSAEFLASSGLFTSGKSGGMRAFFTHRIMFPIVSPKGEIVAFGGRIPPGDPRPDKYRNSAESEVFHKKTMLYGFFPAKDTIRNEKTAVIVEGYMDVVALHQAGIKNAVASMGTSFTPEQARFLRRFADMATLFFDGDAAGQEAAKKCARICEELEFTVYASALPQDKDPADYVQENRVEELQKIVKYPIPILEYFLQKYTQTKADVPAEHAVREFFPYIKSIVSAVRRDAALTRLSGVFGIEKAAITADVQRIKTLGKKERDTEIHTKEKPLSMTPEFLLIIASIDNKEDFSYIRSRLSLDDFDQPESRDVFITLEDGFRSEAWNRAMLLETITDARVKDFILQKLVSGELAQDSRRKMIKDAIDGIQKRNYAKKQKELERELARLDFGKKENEARIAELLEKKMYVDGELEKLRKTRNE